MTARFHHLTPGRQAIISEAALEAEALITLLQTTIEEHDTHGEVRPIARGNLMRLAVLVDVMAESAGVYDEPQSQERLLERMGLPVDWEHACA